MFDCCRYKKCNWCKKRKEDVWTIKVWCKYYGMNICEDCYDIKRDYKYYPSVTLKRGLFL